MKFCSIPMILLAAICLPTNLYSQTIHTVDVQGGGANVHQAITAASIAAVEGDTILIKELVWGVNNQTAGYSESHPGGAESFPIKIRSGVSVRPYDSSQTVVIWSSAATPPCNY